MTENEKQKFKHWHFKAYRTFNYRAWDEQNKKYKYQYVLHKLITDTPFTPEYPAICVADSISQLKLIAAVKFGIGIDDINWWSVDSKKCKEDIAMMKKNGEIL